VAVDNGVVDTYLTARVDDTDIKPVRVGQLVDIDVDTYPQARITPPRPDHPRRFSLFLQSNTQGTGTLQKVTQVIPVKIGFDDLSALIGRDLVPGMNVTIHIHKQT
jgi:membrane fusion protein (multidrug efflux system)